MRNLRKNFVSLFLPVLLLCCCMIFAVAVSCFVDYSSTAIAEEGGISADPVFSIYGGKANSGNESQSYGKIYDNDTGTKYCISILESPYVIFKAEQDNTVVNGYTLYTANDTATHEGRNPKDWKLYGSNNASDWTVIHNVESDSTLGATNQTGYDFNFINTTPYTFYKFEFLSRQYSDDEADYSLMQISEIDFSASISPLQSVSDAESLTTVFTNGGRAKLTADITLTENLSVYAKWVDLDLNGHVISGATITVWSASPSGDSILFISDSDPNATHLDESLPNGGVIYNLEFSRKDSAEQKDEDYTHDAYLFANGGSVINSLHSVNTSHAIVSSSKNTMTHFLGGASGSNPFKINGGIFYDKIETDVGVAFDNNTDVKKVTFNYVVNNAQAVYAYEYLTANSYPIKPFDITPTEENVRFDGWYVGGGYLSNFSAKITADTTYNAVMVKDVASVSDITTAVANGYGVKITQSITITEQLNLASDGQFVLFDINGCVFSSNGGDTVVIKLVGASTPTEMMIIDSRPTTTHTNGNYPIGGYINCQIKMQDCSYENNKYANIYANGGTIRKVYSNSGAGGVWSTSTTPSVIQEVGETGGITINGGVYYWNLGRLGGNKLTFMNGDTVYALAATYASTIVAPKAPTKEGYSFEGWYNGNTLYDFNTPITSALTLTAKWKDIVAPVVSGVDADSVYCQEIEVSVADSSSYTVTVNEAEVPVTDNKFNLDMSDGVDKTIVVTDIDGNVTTITAKFGHSYGEWVNAVAPTCVSVGNLKYRQCSVSTCKQYEYITSNSQTLTCAENEYDTKIKLAVVDHTYGEWINAVAPTCVLVGNLKYRQCSVSTCKGYEYITSDSQTLTCAESEYGTKIELGKLAHAYNNGRYHESSGKHYKKCDNCEYYDSSTETACDYELKSNATQHYQECKICHTAKEHQDHYLFESFAWQKDETYHWRVCSKCSAEYEKDAHDLRNSYNANTHFVLCDDCGYRINEANHTFDNDEDPTCNGCNYLRTIYVESLGFSYSGYALDESIHDISVSITDNSDKAVFEGVYGTSWLVVIGTDSTPTDSDCWIFEKSYEGNCYFVPNTTYWLVLYVNSATDNAGRNLYSLSNLSLSDLTLSDVGSASYAEVGSSSIAVYFKLPNIVGTSTIQSMPDIALTMSGHALDASLYDLQFAIKNASEFVFDSLDIDYEVFVDRTYSDPSNNAVYNTTSRYTLGIYIYAKENYSFVGFDETNLSIDGLGDPLEAYGVEHGGYLYAYYAIPSLMGEHTCDFQWVNTNRFIHYKECTLCYKVQEGTEASHAFDNAFDRTCDTCGYVRDIDIPYLKFNLSGYALNGANSSTTLTLDSEILGVDFENAKIYYTTDPYNFLRPSDYPYLNTSFIWNGTSYLLGNAYYMPNTEYWIVLYLSSTSGYSLENLTASNITVNDDYCTASVCYYDSNNDESVIYIKLPELVGTSTIDTVPEISGLSVSGYEKDATAGGVSITYTQAPTGIALLGEDEYIGIFSFFYADTYKMDEILLQTFAHDGSGGDLSDTAPFLIFEDYYLALIMYPSTGYTFNGFALEDISITGFGNPIKMQIGDGGEYALFVFNAPSFSSADHEHYYSSGYFYNTTHHWKVCAYCNEKIEYAEHTFDENDPTECTVCQEYVRIDSLSFTISGYEDGNKPSNVVITADNALFNQGGGYLSSYVIYSSKEKVLDIGSLSGFLDKDETFDSHTKYYVLYALFLDSISMRSFVLTCDDITLTGYGTAFLLQPYSYYMYYIAFELPTLHTHEDGLYHTEEIGGQYYHYVKCDECDHYYENTKSACDSDGLLITDLTHSVCCSVCQATNGNVGVNHTFSIAKSDDNNHWSECSCGLINSSSVVAHNYNQAKKDENNHWNECTCGKIDASSVTAHTWTSNHDDTHHWKECTCGAIKEKDEHWYKSGSIVCNDCTYSLTVIDSLTFTVSGYERDGSIRDFSITLSAENAGVSTDFNTYVSLIYEKAVENHEYIELVEDEYDYFLPGVQYWAWIVIDTSSSKYTFLGTTADDITVNGAQVVEIYNDNNNTTAYIGLRLPDIAGSTTIENVSEIELTMTGYVEGGVLGDVVIAPLPSDSDIRYDYYLVRALDSSSGANSTFDKNKQYYLMIEIFAKEGYTLHNLDKSMITLNETIPCLGIEPGGSNGYGILVFILPSLYGTHDHVNNENEWKSTADGSKHCTTCSLCYEELTPEDHVYTEESSYICTLCGYENITDISEFNFTLSGFEVDALLKDTTISINDGEVGYTIASNAYYTGFTILNRTLYDAFSSMNSYTENTTARFMTGVKYCFQLIFGIQDGYSCNEFDPNNVKLNGVSATTGGSYGNGFIAFFDMPVFTEGSEYTTIDAELTLSGYVAGGAYSDFSVTTTYAGIGNIEVRLLKHMGGDLDLTSSGSFTNMDAYILELTITSADGYTIAGMDENSISFTDSSQILYFRRVMYDILYDSITYTWYLKHLNPDHEHVYTLTYWDDNGHWMECPTCHAANQSSPHTYAEDDPYHCTTSGCHYSIPEKVTEVNITLDGFSVGHLLSSAQISDGEFGTNSTLALRLEQSIFATSAGVLEGDFSSIIEDSKYRLLDSTINYYLCLVFMYNPNLDFSLLTAEGIILNDTKSASLYTPNYMEEDLCLVVFDLGKVYVDHIHGGTWVNAVEAGCETDGVIGHYECTICGKNFDADDNELTSIVDPAIGHNWNLAFCDTAAANGEGNFHDYKCSNCNSWQGNREACNIDTKWITDDEYHWHECSVCEHKFNYGEHDHVILCDSVDHWERCSVCDKGFSPKESHTFESETSTSCSVVGCPYHRYFEVEIELSGYGVNELLTGLSGSATNKTDNIVMSFDFADFYNENYDKVGSTKTSGNIDYMARFRPEEAYFVVLYFNCGSYYPADTLTINSFTLPDGYVFIDYDYMTETALDGSSYIQLNVCAYMPLLGGVNNSQKMSEIELSIENFVVGNTLSEVTVSTDISTAIVGELVFSKHTTIIDKTTVITNNELIGLNVSISASEGYNFFGYSIDLLSLSSNIGEIMGVTVSNSGSAITVGIELRGVIAEHECVYTTYKNPNNDILDNPDAGNKHRKVCSICGEYVYEDHAFDNYLDKDCSLCNYTRSVVLERLDITLTNYVVDGLVDQVRASVAENDYNVAVVGNYNGDYGIFDSNMKRYFGRVSRFLPNEQYYLNVKITASSIVSFDSVSRSNVYVNGEAVTVHSSNINASSGIITYNLALPMLSGTTTQQKATDIDFTISGLTLGGTVGDVALGELTHSAVAEYDFEIFKKGENTALSSSFIFVSNYQYVLKVRVKLNDYYYSKGMTDGDITVGNLSRVGDIEAYDERFNTTGVGSLVFYTFQIVFDMGEEHVHAFTGSSVTYDSNANGHAPICECGFVSERVAHTYTQEDPTVCSVCGATAIPEEFEFTLSHYFIGMPTYIDENTEVQITYDQNLLQIFYSGLTDDYDLDDQYFGASFDIVLPDRTYAFMIVIVSEIDLMQYSGDKFILNLGDNEYTASYYSAMSEQDLYLAYIGFELPAIEGVHIHGGVWVNEIPATCTTEGVKGHYDCTICDKHFDADNVEITDLTISKIEHSYGTWIEEVPAGCESDGVKGYYQCSDCNAYFDAEHNVLSSLVISAKGHNYGDLILAEDATCLEDGHEAYYKCSACNKYFDSSKVEKVWSDLVIDAHGHNFGTVSYSWNSNNSECIATRSCTYNCNEEGHTQTASATISSTVTQEQSCVDPELTTYTAVFAENWCITRTKTNVQTKAATGHTDSNNDHKCDVCTNVSSVCVDTDGNGRCDICGESMCETCVDENKDHKCDNCGSTMGTHAAPEDGHNCSYCGQPITSCIDSDLDHECDICSATMGVHQGQENSHNCAYCGVKVTEHEGGTATCIKKAICSICGEEYGSLSGHTYGDWREQVDAKCGVDGIVAHKDCTVCNKHFDAQGNVIDNIVIEALEHNYGEIVAEKPATCTESGYEAYYKCSACNKYFNSSKVEKAWEDLVIDAKGHSYGDWVEEAPAGCETTGTKGHYHCSACDTDFDTEYNKLTSLVLPVKGHTYGDWVEQVDATCEANGSVAHKECTVCKKNFDAQGNVIDNIVIEALEHSFGEIVAEKPATCTESGYNAYYKCSVCNKYFDSSKVEKALDDLVIDAKGHSYGDWIEEAPAGCETTGTKGHYHCSACDNDFDADDNKLSSLVISANGHNYGNKVDEQPATCLVDGHQAYYKCSACNKFFNSNKNQREWNDLVISAVGHEYGSVSYSWNTTKTECIATRSCIHNCNEEGHTQTSSATITSTVTQDSSCVEPQLTTYTATFADSWCVTQTMIGVITEEASGHNDADNDHDCDDCGAVVSSCIDDDTDGKCDICGNSMCETCVDGNKDHICDNCGGRVGEHKADENSHNCSYCSQPITSCIDSDLNHKCDICSASMGVHQGQETSHNCAYCGIKVTDHEGGTATCTEQATCTICGEKYGSALGHSLGDLEAREDATCSENGHEAYYKCSICNEYFDSNKVKKNWADLIIPAKGHTYGEWNEGTSATCESVGSLGHYQCSDCNKYFDIDYNEIDDITINTLPHNFGDLVEAKDATCSENGYVAHKDCLICNKHFDADGKEIEDIVIVSTGHSYGYWIDETPAGCETTGTKGHYHCSVCNTDFDAEYNKLASLVLPVKGHTYGDWIEQVDATCEANGSVAHKECTVCKKNFDAQGNVIDNIVIEALEHNFGEIVAEKPATCTESGYNAYYKCSVCNKYFDSSKVEKAWDDLVIDANGHSYGDWIDEVPAGCDTTGTKGHYHCSACDNDFDLEYNVLASLVIPVKGHTYGAWMEKVDATCEANGSVAYKDCTVCHKHFDAENKEIESLVIPANGHSFGEMIDAKDATCTENGYVAHKDCSICHKHFDASENVIENIVVKANGHKFGEMIDAKDATCTENGYVAHKDCSICHKHFDASENVIENIVVKANGHKFGDLISAVGATCTENGIKAHKDCSECNKHFDINGNELTSLELVAIGHKLVKVDAKVATVETEGNIEYYRCENCGKLFKDAQGKEEIVLSETVLAKLELVIEKVDNENVDISKEGISFKANGSIEGKEIKVNGEVVDSSNYTITEDNIIVLNPEYLAGLGNGEHVLTVGDSSSKFTIDFVKEGLSGGAIAGIVIACVFVLAIIAFAIVWFVVLKKSFNDIIAIFKKK